MPCHFAAKDPKTPGLYFSKGTHQSNHHAPRRKKFFLNSTSRASTRHDLCCNLSGLSSIYSKESCNKTSLISTLTHPLSNAQIANTHSKEREKIQHAHLDSNTIDELHLFNCTHCSILWPVQAHTGDKKAPQKRTVRGRRRDVEGRDFQRNIERDQGQGNSRSLLHGPDNVVGMLS